MLPVGFGPGSLGLGCFVVWCCDGMNSTVVDLFMSTVVEIVVEIFVEVAEFPHDHTPHRQKKARSGRAGWFMLFIVCWDWVDLLDLAP